MKPVVHQDAWFLRFQAPLSAEPSSVPPNVRWERRKRPVNAPNPPRAGATQAYHKGRGILFGGVHDVEESEEGIDSEFFNDLFVWNIERNRFYPLGLRKARAAPKKQADDRERRGRAKADEAELLRNLAALESQGTISGAEKMDLGLSDEEIPARPPKPVLSMMPHVRFNSQIAVQGDSLYIFGGTYEQGDREFTFAEMHAIDLGKMDGVHEIFRRELENWQEEAESESESGSDEDMSDDLDGDEGESSGVPLPTSEVSRDTEESQSEVKQEPEQALDNEVGELEQEDTRPRPRPFESLREFFTRTSQNWQELVLECAKSNGEDLTQSVKGIRKIAFEMCETTWWSCREEIMAEEERQEEAGIGEVVSIVERGNEGSGPGRRR